MRVKGHCEHGFQGAKSKRNGCINSRTLVLEGSAMSIHMLLTRIDGVEAGEYGDVTITKHEPVL